MKKPSIKNVIFLGIEIVFDCSVDKTLYDFGAVRLQCEDRTFILDVVSSTINDDESNIYLKLGVDTDTFPIAKESSLYDLTRGDLMSRKISGTLYIGENFHEEPDFITLFVKFINTDGSGCTKAINLDIEW